MDIEAMRAESIISQFIEFYSNIMRDANAQAKGLAPIDEKAMGELKATMDIAKMMFVTTLNVKSVMKEAGIDPDEWDQKWDQK